MNSNILVLLKQIIDIDPFSTHVEFQNVNRTKGREKKMVRSLVFDTDTTDYYYARKAKTKGVCAYTGIGLCSTCKPYKRDKHERRKKKKNKEGRTFDCRRSPVNCRFLLLLYVPTCECVTRALLLSCSPLFLVDFGPPIALGQLCRRRQRVNQNILYFYTFLFLSFTSEKKLREKTSIFSFSGCECCACRRCPARRRTAYDGRPVDSAYALAKIKGQTKKKIFFLFHSWFCYCVTILWIYYASLLHHFFFSFFKGTSTVLYVVFF